MTNKFNFNDAVKYRLGCKTSPKGVWRHISWKEDVTVHPRCISTLNFQINSNDKTITERILIH